MKPVLKSLVLAMTAQALLFAGTQAMAAEIGDRTIRFGYGVPEEHPIGQGVNKFAELVGQKSGGKIKVRKGLVFNDVSPQEIDKIRKQK